MHEPPPRPLRELAGKAVRVLETGGRYLRWLGLALLLIAPLIWWFNRDRSAQVIEQAVLAMLLWAAILVGWHMVLVFTRWWIWWHDDPGN